MNHNMTPRKRLRTYLSIRFRWSDRRAICEDLRKKRRIRIVQLNRNIAPVSETTHANANKVDLEEFDDNDVLQIPTLLEHLADFQRPASQSAAMKKCCWMLLKDHSKAVNRMIKYGIITKLLECLKVPVLQNDAAITLGYFAFDQKSSKEMVEAGVIPVLLQLLDDPVDLINPQAIFAFAKIMMAVDNFADTAMEHGLMERLVELANSNTPLKTLRQVTWLLYVVCSCHTTPLHHNIIERIAQIILELLTHTDPELLTHVLSTVGYLTVKNSLETLPELKCGMALKLIALLSHDAKEIREVVRMTMYYIIKNHIDVLHDIVKSDALAHLPTVLHEEGISVGKRTIRALARWMVAQPEYIQLMIDMGLLSPLNTIMLSDNASYLHEDMALLVSHLTNKCTWDQLKIMENCGFVKSLCKSLSGMPSDTVCYPVKALHVFLRAGDKATANIILECQVFQLIDNLCQEHEEFFSDFCTIFLYKYFNLAMFDDNTNENEDISSNDDSDMDLPD